MWLMKDEALTRRVIGCFLTAYNELGFGFTESVYSAALEMRTMKQQLGHLLFFGPTPQVERVSP